MRLLKILVVLLTAAALASPAAADPSRTAEGDYGRVDPQVAVPQVGYPITIQPGVDGVWCSTETYGTIAPYGCIFEIGAGETTLSIEISDASGLVVTGGYQFWDGWNSDANAKSGSIGFCGSTSNVSVPAGATVVAVSLGNIQGDGSGPSASCVQARTTGKVVVDFFS